MERLPKQSLIRKVRSGVIHIEFFNSEENSIASGSGFLSKNYLITNNHLFKAGSNATKVALSWQVDSLPGSIRKLECSCEEFNSYFKAGSEENNYDYAIFYIPELINKKLHNFTLSMNIDVSICDEALILGFPLQHQTLCCHSAMVSSFYTQNGVNKILLDASVNQSNSGGPLIDMSGNVIGIITRKATGLSGLFDEFCKVFDTNIEMLRTYKGVIVFGNGVDFAELLMNNQVQMKIFSRELLRSANVGIGYAYAIEYLSKELENM